MAVATDRIEVGVRDLKNNLSRHLKSVQAGGEVVVTDRGVPVARLTAIGAEVDRLSELIASGLVRAPESASVRPLPKPIRTKGTVSDLVADQRR